MPMFEIKNRFNGSVLFSLECGSLKLCVEAAVKAKADLSYVNLSYADLSYANLSYANLRSADLSYADLTEKQLRWFRDDIWAVLSSSPKEVAGLRTALNEGRVNGSTYHGECCCLVGTLAHERKCSYDEIPGLTPDSSRPAEVWFYGINKGDTPETNRLSKLALEWVNQWLENVQSAFAVNP